MSAFISDPDGQLGRSLVELLHKEGIGTVNTDRDSVDDVLRAVHEAEIVYLLDDCDGTSGELFPVMREANIDGPRRLIDQMEQGQRAVLLSSVEVYAPSPWPSQWPIAEGHPRRAHGVWPTQIYGQQKIEAEDRLVRSADRRRYDYVLLRSSLRYGAGQGLTSRVMTEVRARPYAAITAFQGLSVMQWVSVGDVARALVSAGRNPAAAGEAFNIVGTETVTIWDLVTQVHGDRFGDRVARRAESRRAARNKFDTDKALATLGWASESRLAEWLTAGEPFGFGKPRPRPPRMSVR